MSNTASILPLWRQAINNFFTIDHHPGAVIRREWFEQEFGIEKPVTADDKTKSDLEFLKSICEFRRELLEVHMIDLKAVQGVGYEVIHPRDQTKHALRVRTQRIAGELRKMGRSIAYVDVNKLTDSERREQSDGLAKAASLRSMFSRRILLGRD